MPRTEETTASRCRTEEAGESCLLVSLPSLGRRLLFLWEDRMGEGSRRSGEWRGEDLEEEEDRGVKEEEELWPC